MKNILDNVIIIKTNLIIYNVDILLQNSKEHMRILIFLENLAIVGEYTLYKVYFILWMTKVPSVCVSQCEQQFGKLFKN